MLTEYHDVELRTAHDVRFLKQCASCGGLGDRRQMLSNLQSYGLPDGYHHGRCVVQILGKGVLLLPPEHSDKLRLSDLGPELVKRLLDRRAAARE